MENINLGMLNQILKKCDNHEIRIIDLECQTPVFQLVKNNPKACWMSRKLRLNYDVLGTYHSDKEAVSKAQEVIQNWVENAKAST